MTHPPCYAELKISFTGWWHSGTGTSGGRDVDMAVYRDIDGCPAMPMTQIKGTLRDTAREFGLLSGEEIATYFGEATAPGEDDAGSAALRFAGEARLGASELAYFRSDAEARAQLFSEMASTAIDEENGTAETDTLRRAEVAVPLDLVGTVEWVEGEPPADWVDRLNAICAFTPAFGKMKNDGYGRAISECRPVQCAERPSGKFGEKTEAANGVVLQLIAEDPFVFSRDAATRGEHRTLTAPTGASLLGWAAGRIYSQLTAAEAYTLFHSGKVRFSDAVPLDDGNALYPRPGILLKPKHGNGEAELGRAAFDRTYNQGRTEAHWTQAEAVGLTAVSLVGSATPGPRVRQRLRTAMEMGTAKEGSLFGYEAAWASSTVFLATIEADDDADIAPETWQLLLDAFAGKSLHLGKARRNGYGGTFHCSVSSGSPWPEPRLPSSNGLLRLWLLTDACVLDEFGTPKFTLDAEHFGLERSHWEAVPSETAVSTRRIWPWNGHLKSRDIELAVIEAGSVFTFRRIAEGVSTRAPDQIIGCHRERGLGRVTMLPEDFKFRASASIDAMEASAESPAPSTPLTRWARSSASDLVGSSIVDDWVDQRITQLSRIIHSIAPTHPSRAQWSNLARAAAARKPLQEIVRDELRQEEWGTPVMLGDEPVALRDWICDCLFKDDSLPDAERSGAAARVAAEARSIVQGLDQ